MIASNVATMGVHGCFTTEALGQLALNDPVKSPGQAAASLVLSVDAMYGCVYERTYIQLDSMLQSGCQGRAVSGTMDFLSEGLSGGILTTQTRVKICLFLIWHINSSLELDMWMSRLHLTAHMSVK